MTTHTPRHQVPTMPFPLRAAVALERNGNLDRAVDRIRRVTRPLGRTSLAPILRGEWLGHALHPLLTDLPLGMWTATTVLDLAGGVESRPAARRLLAIGLLGAVPTAVTGWFEWERAARPAQRVGVVHAALNASAIGLYAGSWAARRRDRHAVGTALALAGAGASGVAGYLGGHLTSARKVSSRHPALRESHDGEAAAGIRDRFRGEVTATDVLEALTAQHARIGALIRQVHATAGDARSEALRELLAFLAGHEAVEQELLHPLVAAADGQDVGHQRSLEESGMAQQIERLEELWVDSPVFDTQLGLFEHALNYHCDAEEHVELPSLSGILTPAAAARLVEAFAMQEADAANRRGRFADMVAAARAQLRSLDPAAHV
ncbi:MAG TPA: hemerythrin domain-containing protein [Intrasporangium sp.]|uniref:hemerythrin domain-containing protein n=1 Tax=Intrasporangium sp. TaxID=1925024 RepID=UPI002D777EF8|nr:hemerythrin domain-containing protein [Intrasporangium sp.]HET7397610.1 hemerythrin domain-containing protein [Intrasporangium sp.]